MTIAKHSSQDIAAQLSDINWHTERLHIRRFQAEDYQLELAYASNPEIMRYIADIDDLADVKQKVQSSFNSWQANEGEWLLLPICLKDTAFHIGMVCLRFESLDFSRVEIGYRFHPDYHGQGYGIEAVTYVVDFLFHQLKVHKISAYCVAEHYGSYRLMEKLGMQREAVLREHSTLAGKWHDELVYGLLRSEYQAH